MTERLKLYTSPSAFPNPQRLRLFLHEKGSRSNSKKPFTICRPGEINASGHT